jgi:single-strand DNA-binding protein
MNKIMLIGNLGRDPEMNYTPEGTAVAKFTIAVNRFSKSSTGERQQDTDWFNIVAWRDLAERSSTYLKKGQKVFIEGRLSIRKYTDKNGIERTAIEVIATDMEFLTPKDRQTTASSSDILSGDDSLGDLEDHPF